MNQPGHPAPTTAPDQPQGVALGKGLTGVPVEVTSGPIPDLTDDDREEREATPEQQPTTEHIVRILAAAIRWISGDPRYTRRGLEVHLHPGIRAAMAVLHKTRPDMVNHRVSSVRVQRLERSISVAVVASSKYAGHRAITATLRPWAGKWCLHYIAVL